MPRAGRCLGLAMRRRSFLKAGGATAQVERFSFVPLGLVCWQSSPRLTPLRQAESKLRGIFLRCFGANLWSLPWGGRISGGSSHIEILHNNVHHIEQNFPRPVGTEPGGNGLGIGVYGTDAKRTDKSNCLDRRRSVVDRFGGEARNLPPVAMQFSLVDRTATPQGMPTNCLTMRAADLSGPFRES
jgi:hypothetical protein